ncbi:MAG: hypothetical protein GY874_13035, partial [Desulfobacteraceae bacterium]|nr:hypothetical protein [Desulfobacteraceae bacterium]
RHRPIRHRPIRHRPIRHRPIRHRPIRHRPIRHRPIRHRPIRHLFFAGVSDNLSESISIGRCGAIMPTILIFEDRERITRW